MLKLPEFITRLTLAAPFVVAAGVAQAQQGPSASHLPLAITHCTDVAIEQDDDLIGVRTFFKTDRCQMNGDHYAAIDRAIALARAENPGERLTAFVIGETDPRASDEYNIRLGQRRATALAGALQQRGVSVLHIASIGESTAPQHIRDNPEARASYAVIGDEASIRACLAQRGCAVDHTVRSALRPD
jgi:outer membrane protein OmpA-like peptidoglycan-associated protein